LLLSAAFPAWAEEIKTEQNFFTLEVADNLINLQAEQASFKEILSDLEKKTGIKVNIFDGVEDKKVTLNISALPFYAIHTLLKKIELENFAVVYDRELASKVVYILPEGVRDSTIIQAEKVYKQIDMGSFKDFPNAKEIILKKVDDLFEIPEIKTLLKLAENEKTKDIHYERVITPKAPVSVYSFRVKYFNELKMMLPYLKNEKPVSGKMEGFANFYSVYNFIKSQANKLQAYAFNNKLFLKMKGDEEFSMMITGTPENLTVISKSRMLDVYLNGNNESFHCMSKIYHNVGTITNNG
jgi:hypothetical protein